MTESKGSPEVSPLQQANPGDCQAQEWQRDGRGLWAMRECKYYQGHGKSHYFGSWQYNVTASGGQDHAFRPDSTGVVCGPVEPEHSPGGQDAIRQLIEKLDQAEAALLGVNGYGKHDEARINYVYALIVEAKRDAGVCHILLTQALSQPRQELLTACQDPSTGSTEDQG